MAVSDELGLLAHPRPAILARTIPQLVDAIVSAVEREGASEVVVGLPLLLSGEASEQTAHARQVARALCKRLEIPVTECDERLSSVEAGRSVHGAARRKSGELDSAAAAVVLQAVLDRRRSQER